MAQALSFRPTFVMVDGPFPDQDRDGDEVGSWSITLNDDDGNEALHSTATSYTAAVEGGQQLAKQRRIELVIEATRD